MATHENLDPSKFSAIQYVKMQSAFHDRHTLKVAVATLKVAVALSQEENGQLTYGAVLI